MALLEHRFKTTLLERSSRGVEVTPAGASLLPHAMALLVEINQMQADMRDHADGRKGALRILANTSVKAGSSHSVTKGRSGNLHRSATDLHLTRTTLQDLVDSDIQGPLCRKPLLLTSSLPPAPRFLLPA